MGVKEMYELEPACQRSRKHELGRAIIVVCQNVLLWVAFYVAASTIYILVVGAVNLQNIPSAVMYMVAVCLHPVLASTLWLIETAEHLISALPRTTEYCNTSANEHPKHDATRKSRWLPLAGGTHPSDTCDNVDSSQRTLHNVHCSTSAAMQLRCCCLDT